MIERCQCPNIDVLGHDPDCRLVKGRRYPEVVAIRYLRTPPKPASSSWAWLWIASVVITILVFVARCRGL